MKFALTQPPFPSDPGLNLGPPLNKHVQRWESYLLLFAIPYLNKQAAGSEGLIRPSLGKVGEGREQRRRGEGEGGPGELIMLTQRRH